VREQDHIFRMTSRKPAFVISKLHHDLVRGGILGLLVFLGLFVLLVALYFGL
jgi:preprotein translocase subunit SecF